MLDATTMRRALAYCAPLRGLTHLFLLIRTHLQGNPNEREAFEYIKTYSPLDNVRPPPSRAAQAARHAEALRGRLPLRAGGADATPRVLRAGYSHPHPPTLLTAGLNDSRVAYWEAAKFAARLRDAAEQALARDAVAAGSALTPAALAAIRARAGANIALKTDMGAGHFSLSDRYLYLREKAFAYAFVCDSLGVEA